ncbi:MAG TPA: hypothetical protein VES88_12030 [Gemmatimonadaceae bacterium]|nr:hypothetical protein [Gemmatimonadaceae bacterium]
MPKSAAGGDNGETIYVDLTKSENVDLTKKSKGPAPRVVKWDPVQAKTQGGQWIAKGIVVIFGLSILYSVVVTSLGVWQHSTASSGVKEFGDGLDAIAKFGTTLFSPLLSFILGYYFGERNSAQASSPPPNGNAASDDSTELERNGSPSEQEPNSEPAIDEETKGKEPLPAAEKLDTASGTGGETLPVAEAELAAETAAPPVDKPVKELTPARDERKSQ